MNCGKRILLNLALIGAALCFYGGHWLIGQTRSATPSRFSKWRPTREFPGADYVGNDVCLQCHKDKVLTQSANSMGRAAEVADKCSSITTRQNLRFTNGPYVYTFGRSGRQNFFTVTDGQRELSASVLFCFGQGRLGQTYILEHDGTLYESRVSYYREIGNLDFTILHPHSVPASLEEALGRPLTKEAAKGCFSCHTTGAIHNGQLQIERLVPGVGCEACHGPGDKHVTAMRTHRSTELQIFTPEDLESDELTQEFCGACHRGFEQVLSLPGQDGINNVRYQPYRIFNSPGHTGDKRISCVACHNPHDRLEHDDSFYTAKCLACHRTNVEKTRDAARAAPPCPQSNQRCASCHMQKVELRGAHASFTDHWIRVVKTGDRIPR
jgi:hypothetical protein